MLEKFSPFRRAEKPEPPQAPPGTAPVPEPPKAPPGTALVPVPIHRGSYEVDRPAATMGFLDRHPDSARPGMTPTPYLRTADEQVRQAWGPLAAHTRHMLTQSGFLSYGVELVCAWTVGGDGLQPNINPDAVALGWQDSFAQTWARELEAAFVRWSNDPRACDAQGRLRFGAIQNAALKSYLATGDVLCQLDYGKKAGTAWKTAVALIDPVRLWTPPVYASPATVIRQGIEFDARGRPLAFHIRPLPGFSETIRVPVYSRSDKQLMLHVFDSDVGAIRGISPLAAAIQGILQTQNMADAAILAAHIASTIVGVVTSDFPPESVARRTRIGEPDDDAHADLMEQRIAWHSALKKNDAHLRLNGGRVAHLHSGEKFDLKVGKEQFDAYELILKNGLREAARAIGLAPEHLTGDKAQSSYSALKHAAVEVRAIVERRRRLLIEPLTDWALDALAEELISAGELPYPVAGFENPLKAYRATRSYIAVNWRGPSIGDPDQLKEVRAAMLRVQSGLSSLSDEIEATGKDPEAVFRQRTADEQQLKALGLTLPWPANPTNGVKS